MNEIGYYALPVVIGIVVLVLFFFIMGLVVS